MLTWEAAELGAFPATRAGPVATAHREVRSIVKLERSRTEDAVEQPGERLRRAQQTKTKEHKDGLRVRLQECRCRGVRLEGQRRQEEELLAKVKEHAEQKHNVGGVTDTIVNYARASIRQS